MIWAKGQVFDMICPYCQKDFPPKPQYNKKFCSKKCKVRWRFKQRRWRTAKQHKEYLKTGELRYFTDERKCPICNRIFFAKVSSQKYCSKECKKLHKNFIEVKQTNYVTIEAYIWLKQAQGKHFCQCGCEEKIKIHAKHYYKGVPRFKRRHHSLKDAKIALRKLRNIIKIEKEELKWKLPHQKTL